MGCVSTNGIFFPGPQWTTDSILVEFPIGKSIPGEQGLVPVSQLPCWSPRAKVFLPQQSFLKGKLLEETTGQEGFPWVSLSWFQTVGQLNLLPFPLNQ